MQNSTREGSALRSPAAWVWFLTVIVVGTALDLWTKHWAYGALEQESTRWPAEKLDALQQKIPFLEFIWQPNYGAVLGVGQGQTTLFIAFTFLALALLTWLFVDSHRKAVGLQLALACVMAGAVGNLYDRMQFGYVRDFLRFIWQADWAKSWGGPEGYLYPYIFNIADVFISLGVCGLFVAWLIATIRHWRTSKQAAAEKA